MQELELPDGTVIEFDDSVRPEVMNMVAKNYVSRPYEHQTFTNPLQGVAEAFAQGVYEAPGQLAAIADEFSPWARVYNALSGKTLQSRMDDLTGVNELGYTPDEYGASPLLQSVSRLLGNVTGDPLNAIPMGMVGKAGALRAVDTLSDDALTTPMRNQLGMITWQGSPHKYDGVLDPTKIGTGEGAQAYGYGHYLAEQKRVGEMYKQSTTSPQITFGDKSIEELKRVADQGDIDSIKAIDSQMYVTQQNKNDRDYIFDEIKRRDWVKDLEDKYGELKYDVPGHLYKFDLDDNAIERMLDWDAPLSEQPEAVRNAWNDFKNSPLGKEADDSYHGAISKGEGQFSNPTGRDIYAAYQEGLPFDLPLGRHQVEASNYFRELGIPGIKYYDGSSRAAGEGTRNFVVFPGNENLVTPLERNGEPLGNLGAFKSQLGAVDLPMDEASRMARAREMGNDIPVYHASTHDISAFDLSRANPESDMGAAIYTTNSPADASFNYSSLDGQDLTARIQLRAEQLADEMGLDFDDPKVMEAAKAELYGGAENVMPLLGRMEKPLKIGGDDRTFLEYRMKELDPEDYLDDADGDMDLAQELAWEDAYNYEPEGELVDLINALQNNRFGVDASESITKLSELGMDGGMYADDIMDILKNDYNLMDAYDDSGALASNELIRQAFEDVGFDGIIDSGVNTKWGTGSGRTNYMRGMDEDTRHYLFFQPNQLRSRFAKFDPAKKDSADLLASKLLPIPAGLLGLTTLDPDN